MAPFEYATMTSLDGSGGGGPSGVHGGGHGQPGPSGTRTILDINLNLYKTGSSGQGFYGEPVSTTSAGSGGAGSGGAGSSGAGSSAGSSGGAGSFFFFLSFFFISS